MATDLAEVLHKLATEQVEFEQRKKRLLAEVAECDRGLDRIAITRSELERLGVDVESIPAPPADLRNDERIVQVVNEAEGPILDTSVLAALTETGWHTESADPLALVRSYLSRAVKAGQIVKLGRSMYASSAYPATPRLAEVPMEIDPPLTDEKQRIVYGEATG